MGCLRTESFRDAERAVALASGPIRIFNVNPALCEGQMTFVKRSTGDRIFIGLRGKQPTPTDYDIVLEDVGTSPGPFYSEDGLVQGEIWALGSAAGSILSSYISYRVQGA